MALDSALKRFAVVGVGRPYMRSTFPVAAKTEAWRVSVGLAYPVAALSAPTEEDNEAILSIGNSIGPSISDSI